MVDSKKEKDTKVLMMPYNVALDYADRALRVTTHSGLPPREQLQWLMSKDKLTRATMAAYVRDHWPAGEALSQALADTATEWSVIHGSGVRGPMTSILDYDDPSSPPKTQRVTLEPARERSRGGKPAGQRPNKKSAIGQIASVTRSGQKLCGGFNSKHGCPHKEKDCPRGGLHCCAVIVDEKRNICMSKRHGAPGHKIRD